MAGTTAALRSRVAGVAWPAMPSTHGAQLLALSYQFEHTQWWPAKRLLEQQLRQVRQLLRHAAATVPFNRERLRAAGFDATQPLTLEMLRALPLLTRRDIQLAGVALHCTDLPAAYGRVGQTRTSGYTGEPLTVRRTRLDHLLWEVNALRDHHWHQRDSSGKLAIIRSMGDTAPPPNGSLSGNWGSPAAECYKTGPFGEAEHCRERCHAGAMVVASRSGLSADVSQLGTDVDRVVRGSRYAARTIARRAYCWRNGGSGAARGVRRVAGRSAGRRIQLRGDGLHHAAMPGERRLSRDGGKRAGGNHRRRGQAVRPGRSRAGGGDDAARWCDAAAATRSATTPKRARHACAGAACRRLRACWAGCAIC